MATTINSYAVSLSLNAADYIRNSSLSRSETEALKRTINASRSPMDNYTRTMNLLNKALQTGAIDQKTYNRLLDAQRDKLQKLTATNTAGLKSVKQLVAGYLSFATVRSVVQGVVDLMHELDDLSKSARVLGVSGADLSRFSFAVGEIAGVSGPAAVAILQRLSKSIGEAAEGFGRGSRWLNLLGLDLQELRSKTPTEQFNVLINAMRGLEDQSTRIAAATALFGEEGVKLLPIINSTAKEFEGAANQIDRFGMAFSDEQLGKIEAANDSIGRLTLGIKSLYAELVGSDAFKTAADNMTRWVAQFRTGLQVIKQGKDANAIEAEEQAALARIAEEQAFMRSQVAKKRAGTLELTDRQKLLMQPDSIASPENLGGGVDKVAAAIKDTAATSWDWLSRVVNTAESAAGMITMSGALNTDKIIESQNESPAIAALEVGTQEAYSFLTQASRDAEQKQREEAERKKQIDIAAEKQRNRQITILEKINVALENNGFKRIR